MEDQKNCHCGKPTSGFKCAQGDCGVKTEAHDADHEHDGVKTCEPCCTGCDEAQSNCGCGAGDAPAASM